jgi:hypothetical protein
VRFDLQGGQSAACPPDASPHIRGHALLCPPYATTHFELRRKMTSPDLPAQIEKTGFVLENRIAQILKAARWTVISNRYYIDDAKEAIREIDLVAYKTTKVKHLDIYTALIISCKKSAVHLWAFLARDINLNDPNSDWQPLHAWSNDKAVTYQLALNGAVKRYHEAVNRAGVTNALQIPTVEVFAFQEMDKTTGKPKNDSNIYESVIQLMKAQAYELGALPQRKKTPSIYQFNLLTIVDSDLIRLMFSGQTIDASPVDDEHLIARYIINKREAVSRIRFIKADKFEGMLPEYDKLHSTNCQWFDTEYDDFYNDVIKNPKRVAVLIGEFRKKIRMDIRLLFMQKKLKPPEDDLIDVYWSKESASVRIGGFFGEDGEGILNADINTKKNIASALLKVFRYQGPFEFIDDIPF